MNTKLSKVVKFLAVSNIFIFLNWALIILASPLSGQEILGFEIFLFAQVVLGFFLFSRWSRRAQSLEEAVLVQTAQIAEACGD